jgi:hypothetical protein
MNCWKRFLIWEGSLEHPLKQVLSTYWSVDGRLIDVNDEHFEKQ